MNWIKIEDFDMQYFLVNSKGKEIPIFVRAKFTGIPPSPPWDEDTDWSSEYDEEHPNFGKIEIFVGYYNSSHDEFEIKEQDETNDNKYCLRSYCMSQTIERLGYEPTHIMLIPEIEET